MQPGMTPTDRAEVTSATYETVISVCDETVLIQTVAQELQERLGNKRFSLWFDGKIRLSITDDRLTIAVGSPFLLNWMQKQFRPEIVAAAQAVLGPSAEATFTVDATLAVARPTSGAAKLAKTSLVQGDRASGQAHGTKEADAENDATNAETENVSRRNPRSSNVRSLPLATPAVPNSTFVATASPASSKGRRLAELNDFIPGPQTELALTAAKQIAGGQHVPFNPLYICGPVGSGKTHLVEGICRQLKRTQPGSNVVLLTAEAFANYFTQALREHSLPSFRQRFRSVDALIVDNVEFFESKRVFQEEFLHTFADLADHGRQLVLTGTRHPRLLTKLSDELVSRFQSGLVCRLESPDLATRIKIAETKASRLTGEFAPEALRYLAERFQGSVRELEGALNCLQAHHSMTRKRVTLSAAREILSDLERDCLRMIRLADIERVICNVFGLRPKDLQSESRIRTVSQPRMLAMFLARKHTPSAYTEIGQHFGGRNHSTVMSAERKVQQWVEQNETIKVASQSWSIGEILQTLEQQLLAG